MFPVSKLFNFLIYKATVTQIVTLFKTETRFVLFKLNEGEIEVNSIDGYVEHSIIIIKCTVVPSLMIIIVIS